MVRPEIHHFLIFNFGIYTQPITETMCRLSGLNYNLSKVYETTWKGMDVYVIGTDNKEDSISNQFWVDKENLFVVRVLTNIENHNSDAHFIKWRHLFGNWVATEIVFHIGESYI